MASIPPPDPETAPLPGGSPAAEPATPPPEISPPGTDIDVPDPGAGGLAQS